MGPLRSPAKRLHASCTSTVRRPPRLRLPPPSSTLVSVTRARPPARPRAAQPSLPAGAVRHPQRVLRCHCRVCSCRNSFFFLLLLFPFGFVTPPSTACLPSRPSSPSSTALILPLPAPGPRSPLPARFRSYKSRHPPAPGPRIPVRELR